MVRLRRCGVHARPHCRVGRVLAGLLPLLIAGCATPPGTSVPQQITVETPGCPGARCELSNDRGTWVLAATPGTVTVSTSSTPLRLSCQGSDGLPAVLGTPSSALPPSGAGAVVGGVAGGGAMGAALGATVFSVIPVLGVIAVLGGAGLGAATGQAVEAHAQALRYPETIKLPMACGTAVPQAGAEAPAFGFRVRSIDAAAARASGLPEGTAALVSQVDAGSAAERAGLRAGDLVLSAGASAVHDATGLEAQVRALAPGQTLRLRVWRQGQALVCTLARGALP